MGARQVRRLLLPAVAIALVVTAPAALAQSTPVSALLEQPAAFECTATTCPEVTVTGELVGDYGTRRDGSAWVQLNDDLYVQNPLREGGEPAGSNVAIGLRLDEELLVGLETPGRYQHRGPVVTVTGRFFHHDPERGGETYIDVADLTVIEPGRQLPLPSHWWSAALGGVLLAGSAVVGVSRLRSIRSRWPRP